MTTTNKSSGRVAAMLRARDKLQDDLLSGHGCSMCPRVEIDPNLPLDMRQKMADFLWREHLRRAVQRRIQKRRNHRATV